MNTAFYIFASALLVSLALFSVLNILSSDDAWGRHVRNKKREGIDPSSLKRTDEWESSNLFNYLLLLLLSILGFAALLYFPPPY